MITKTEVAACRCPDRTKEVGHSIIRDGGVVVLSIEGVGSIAAFEPHSGRVDLPLAQPPSNEGPGLVNQFPKFGLLGLGVWCVSPCSEAEMLLRMLCAEVRHR